jgi:hypothetical protein
MLIYTINEHNQVLSVPGTSQVEARLAARELLTTNTRSTLRGRSAMFEDLDPAPDV